MQWCKWDSHVCPAPPTPTDEGCSCAPHTTVSPSHTKNALVSPAPTHSLPILCVPSPSLSMDALWFLVWFFSSFSFFVLRAASASVTQTPCVFTSC